MPRLGVIKFGLGEGGTAWERKKLQGQEDEMVGGEKLVFFGVCNFGVEERKTKSSRRVARTA